MRIVSGGNDDPHSFCYGTVALDPDKVFVILVSTINSTDFLKIVEANESKRFLRIVSERKGDPKGIIDMQLRFMFTEAKDDHCTITFRSLDDQWLQKNKPDKPIKLDRVKMVEGSLILLLTSPISWAESESRLARERERSAANRS